MFKQCVSFISITVFALFALAIPASAQTAEYYLPYGVYQNVSSQYVQPPALTGIILEKEVKTQGGEFVKADTEASALNMGNITSAKVTYRVTVTNLTGITLTMVELEENFRGNDQVTISNIHNVNGAAYDPTTERFRMEREIYNADSYSFTYDANIVAQSANGMGKNVIKVTDYKSRSGLVIERKSDIGLSDNAYTQFGLTAVNQPTSVVDNYVDQIDSEIAALINNTDLTQGYAEINIMSSTQTAKAGDSITYQMNVTNNTDTELTGITVRDNYNENLVFVANVTEGYDNGSELSWSVGTLQPYETVTLSYSAVVRDEASYEDTVLTNNVRLYSDEYSHQIVANSDIHIAPKFAGFLAGSQKSLPKTGLPLIGVVLASLGIAAIRRK